MLFLYGERNVARDVGSEKLDDFVQLIRQDFSIKEEVIVFQTRIKRRKLSAGRPTEIDGDEEEFLLDRCYLGTGGKMKTDKIKVLVQARENLTSASKLNDTRVKGNEIIEYTRTISLLI